MTKKGIIFCLLSVAMAAYLLVAFNAAGSMAAEAPCTGVAINVAQDTDTLAAGTFVTAGDIDRELDSISRRITGTAASQIDLQQIEDRLTDFPNVESANCRRMADDRLCIDVVPMRPVARVFDGRRSYYINSSGKRLKASLHYRVDAPIILLSDSVAARQPHTLAPLLAEIEKDDVWRSLVEMIKIAPNGDVLIYPSTSGHVVNFGSPEGAADKFRRLLGFYAKVMPTRGWNYYDTISVKYAGQVIGRVAPGSRRQLRSPYAEEDLVEDIDIDAMTADNISVNEVKPKI